MPGWSTSPSTLPLPRQMGVGRSGSSTRSIGSSAAGRCTRTPDVEGITYVWKGSFRHADSLSNDGVLQPAASSDDAGSGRAFRANHPMMQPMEFLQLWILRHAKPATGIRSVQFIKRAASGRLLQVIGPMVSAELFARTRPPLRCRPALGTEYPAFPSGRGGLSVPDEGLVVARIKLSTGDAVKIHEEPELGCGQRSERADPGRLPLDFNSRVWLVEEENESQMDAAVMVLRRRRDVESRRRTERS